MEVIKNKIRAAYEAIALRYNELIDHKPHNAYYDRPTTLRLIGDAKEKVILDAACGPGKYAEILISQGAEVSGFDISPTMIELAKSRNGSSGHFFIHDLQHPLTQFSDESFDVIVCALAMHYIKDWNDTLEEFNRVLKHNGNLVISIEHPFFDFNYYKSKKYFQIEHVCGVWNGFGNKIEMHCYRRPLNECIEPITNNGFLIQKIVEPLPSPEFESRDPKHFKELNAFPAFLCIKAIKHAKQTKGIKSN